MGYPHGPVVNGVIQIDQRVKFMKEVQSGLFYPWSNNWYVDQDDGNNNYDGKGPSSSKKTIIAAEAAMAARDTIFLRPGSTDHNIAAALTFDLNDISVIGLSRNRFQPHVELSMPATTSFNPMITFSGRGSYFANMTIKHGSQYTSGVGYAADLTCALISGRYNTFDNVYFYTPLYAEQDVANTNVGANDGYYGVEVSGHNNYFYQCKFGSDGLSRDQLNFNVLLHGGVGNIFEDCIFQMAVDGTTPLFIGVDSVPRDMKLTQFLNCRFYAHSANYTVTPADAFQVHGGGATAGVFFDSRCQFINVSNVSDTANDDWLWKPVVRGEHGADTEKRALIATKTQGA